MCVESLLDWFMLLVFGRTPPAQCVFSVDRYGYKSWSRKKNLALALASCYGIQMVFVAVQVAARWLLRYSSQLLWIAVGCLGVAKVDAVKFLW